MKNIEIITTQNVVLQYELASLRDRILAFVLDIILLTVAVLMLTGIVSGIFAGSEALLTIGLFMVSCVFIFYSLAFESLNNGQSLGKMAMKIRVIKLAGGHATFSDYAARWAFRMIDIYFSLGGVALILIMSSSKAQRIGDIIANTAVIKTVPNVDIDLHGLLAIHNTSYTPKYQQAKKLQEQEALLIKTTLERYRKFENVSHAEALTMLAERVREILGIDDAGEPTVFLRTVLQDYIVLSR